MQGCRDCVLKHIGSALVLMDEIVSGYPQHRIYVIGHLDQAANECDPLDNDLRDEIRTVRLDFMSGKNRSGITEALVAIAEIVQIRASAAQAVSPPIDEKSDEKAAKKSDPNTSDCVPNCHTEEHGAWGADEHGKWFKRAPDGQWSELEKQTQRMNPYSYPGSHEVPYVPPPGAIFADGTNAAGVQGDGLPANTARPWTGMPSCADTKEGDAKDDNEPGAAPVYPGEKLERFTMTALPAWLRQHLRRTGVKPIKIESLTVETSALNKPE